MNKTNHIYKALLLLFGILSVARSENNDIVVFVHGLASDASTWEYRKEIEEAGLRTIAVNINAFESNHDRAISLFAQLKGTKIDYGVCHSRTFGHLRFGKDYTGQGLIPDWSETNRVHFVGHSMGGTTIRHLERLLEQGSGCPEDDHILFQGGKDWITSITTMASPIDGTTAPEQIPFGADEFFINLFIQFSGDMSDLTFPQWGFNGPEEGERDGEYLDRLKDSGLFFQQDFSVYDLSPAGALDFNTKGSGVLRNDRHYFSFASERTRPSEDCVLWFFSCDPVEDPERDMSFSLKFTAGIIGGADTPPDDRPNDGIVNQIRARCPLNQNCKDVPDDITSWSPGQWHVVSIGYLDHYQITDRDDKNDNNNFLESGKRLYLQHGVRLKNLPSSSLKRLSAEENFESSEQFEHTKRYLDAMDALTGPITFDESDKMSAGGIAVIFFITFFGVIGLVATGLHLKKKRTNTNSMEVGTPSKVTL